MKTIKTLRFSLIVLAAMLVPAVAFAQISAPAAVNGALPAVSLPVAVVTLLSLLIGVLTSLQQTGKLFGQYKLPPAFVTIIAIILPFLGGALSVLKGITIIDGSAVFWAVAVGVGQMMVSSATGLAMQAHHAVPNLLATFRPAKQTKTVPPLAASALMLIVGAMFFVGGTAGCTNGQLNPQVVSDVGAGLTAAACVLNTYSNDMAAGRGDTASVADAILKCGVSAAQASGILGAHRRAEVLEGKLAACAPQMDGGK